MRRPVASLLLVASTRQVRGSQALRFRTIAPGHLRLATFTSVAFDTARFGPLHELEITFVDAARISSVLKVQFPEAPTVGRRYRVVGPSVPQGADDAVAWFRQAVAADAGEERAWEAQNGTIVVLGRAGKRVELGLEAAFGPGAVDPAATGAFAVEGKAVVDEFAGL